MAVDVAELVPPEATAVLTMEMQRGVIGDLSAIPQLALAAAEGGVIGHTAGLVGAARRAGVRVVHCTAEFRADLAGSAINCPMLAGLVGRPGHLVAGTAAVSLVPQLGPEPGDLMSPRRHGVSPFTGTSLDVTLRNLGVRTVVATGVSVNLGILGLAIEAVNLGYRVVLPVDCVAGTPADYAETVIARTLSLLAVRTTAGRLIELWSASG